MPGNVVDFGMKDDAMYQELAMRLQIAPCTVTVGQWREF